MSREAQLEEVIRFIQRGLHPYYTGAIDADFGNGSKAALAAQSDHAFRYRSTAALPSPLAPETAPATRIFTENDYRLAASRIKTAAGSARPIEELVAAIKAFKEVESGDGWFTDVARITALDGPGGWLDGTALPKILFEAHWFDRNTGGKYRVSHPNLSSRSWNRALYVGGPGEWERLHRAMALDKTAALLSASVGTFQIMGFNFKAAGFKDVQSFWDAHMDGGAAAHMGAFVSFIINSGSLAAKIAKIDHLPKNAEPAAEQYNGEGFRQNDYHTKIAKAYVKHLG